MVGLRSQSIMNLILVFLVLAAMMWPGLTEELLDQLPSCAVCQKNSSISNENDQSLTLVKQLNCTTKAIERSGCSETDKACLCADLATLATSMSVCSTGVCSTVQLQCKRRAQLNRHLLDLLRSPNTLSSRYRRNSGIL